jgi:hypothetical protein
MGDRTLSSARNTEAVATNALPEHQELLYLTQRTSAIIRGLSASQGIMESRETSPKR